MSPAAKALYNRLVAEKINNEDFRIEILEYYYDDNFAIKKTYMVIPVGPIPEDIKQLSAYVMEEDFKLVVDEYKRVFSQPSQRGILSGRDDIEKIIYDSITFATESVMKDIMKNVTFDGKD